jgi:hypothetical protein
MLDWLGGFIGGGSEPDEPDVNETVEDDYSEESEP